MIQPDCARAFGADRLAGQRKARRGSDADRAREEPCATVAGYEPDLDEAFREGRPFRSDAEIAHRREIASDADGRPIHRRDHRNVEALEGERDPLHAAPIIVLDLERGTTATEARAGAHLFQISACAESRIGTGEDDDALGAIGVESDEAVDEFGAVLEARDRVAALRTVKPDDRDGATIFYGEIAHGASSGTRAVHLISSRSPGRDSAWTPMAVQGHVWRGNTRFLTRLKASKCACIST